MTKGILSFESQWGDWMHEVRWTRHREKPLYFRILIRVGRSCQHLVDHAPPVSLPMKSSASDKDPLVQDREDAATRGMANENDDVVRIFSHFDLDGIPYARAVLTPNSDRRRKEIHCDPRPPIPVIFIPG